MLSQKGHASIFTLPSLWSVWSGGNKSKSNCGLQKTPCDREWPPVPQIRYHYLSECLFSQDTVILWTQSLPPVIKEFMTLVLLSCNLFGGKKCSSPLSELDNKVLRKHTVSSKRLLLTKKLRFHLFQNEAVQNIEKLYKPKKLCKPSRNISWARTSILDDRESVNLICRWRGELLFLLFHCNSIKRGRNSLLFFSFHAK